MKHTKDFEITAIVTDTYLLTAKDGHIITIEEAMANEKLFEIAPELLEALKEIIECQYNSKKTLANLNGLISNAKELIKKAS